MTLVIPEWVVLTLVALYVVNQALQAYQDKLRNDLEKLKRKDNNF